MLWHTIDTAWSNAPAYSHRHPHKKTLQQFALMSQTIAELLINFCNYRVQVGEIVKHEYCPVDIKAHTTLGLQLMLSPYCCTVKRVAGLRTRLQLATVQCITHCFAHEHTHTPTVLRDVNVEYCAV